MLCPKCFGRLEPRFSREVEVDVCEDCGGIFLDRGELRKIIEGAEPVVLARGGSAVQDGVPNDTVSQGTVATDDDPVERRVEFEPSQTEPRRRDRDDDADRDRDDRKKKSKDRDRNSKDRDSKDRDSKSRDSKKSESKKSKKSKKKRKKGWADMLEDVLDDVLDF